MQYIYYGMYSIDLPYQINFQAIVIYFVAKLFISSIEVTGLEPIFLHNT